ncbi:InlB B-repeat-containing protein [Corallococcus exiguus]|uniref:InlB B-repeat-containing protein n=1 Tax=Corallococcus exiguus TaxID=83462 RepID=UPI001471B209|nr:VWD domain-containing protein [Corallococcus exiguus]
MRRNGLIASFRLPHLRPALGTLVLAASLCTATAEAAALRVMPLGLGSGTVTGTGINCTNIVGSDCDETYSASASVTLTATPSAGSSFQGWNVDLDADLSSTPDCTGTTPSCTLTMGVARSVKPVFRLAAGTVNPIPVVNTSAITPEEIEAYLNNPANAATNTVARFISALPAEYRASPILMARSESLQTGTAEHPRLLLSSQTARSVFSIGPAPHASYPGSHPDVIEYMQWDEATKNFRFHEIILTTIPQMGSIPPRSRHIEKDDGKCAACHSTRNVLNLTGIPGTTGFPVGVIKTKNKPNWDPYDSWGGMLPFNRDRLYQGSVDTAAFRKLFNPWTWRTQPEVRRLIEQLRLQPPGRLPAGSPHLITRYRGGPNDGTPRFSFDLTPPVTTEPVPSGTATIATAYAFNAQPGSGALTSVTRGGPSVTLFHDSLISGDEGRGVQLFDLLGGFDGSLNQRRIADELASHRWATGSVFVDPRPVALAITKGCLTINSSLNTVQSSPSGLAVNLPFFTSRNGMGINALRDDTLARTQSIPRRKADIEKLNLSRAGDPYLMTGTTVNGLIPQYGAATSASTDVSLTRLRQEVFRRPIDNPAPDSTVMGGILVDRENYSPNTNLMALYRYFLEPLGVSVDKWSLGVRGRSRAYGFADVFSTYTGALQTGLEANLMADPIPGLAAPFSCASLIPAVNTTLASLPPVGDYPTYTDVQRIFNKACIECHGGLDYPPYKNFGTYLNLAEDQSAPGVNPLTASYAIAAPMATSQTGPLFDRITRTSEDCPNGMMPCGGPPLSQTDVETIRRWIIGGNPSLWGDPHLTTMDGVRYDFQGAGEYVLLRDPGLELQARHTPVQTEQPVGPDPHTGLTACASITTAVAVRVGPHRVSYQMNAEKPELLVLRVDGKPVSLDKELLLPAGGRITSTGTTGGIRIESAGGTRITVTTDWWAHYGLWYMNIDVRQARAREGLLGPIAPGNWLPVLPDGSQLGARPSDLGDRYVGLYEKFGESWRVTKDTSLFDYASGYSPESYTLREWPGYKADSCRIEKAPPGIPVVEPLKAIPLEQAEALCKGVSKERLRDCAQDVAATGDPVFAKTFVTTEKLGRNLAPETLELVTPKENAITSSSVTFEWKVAYDKDGDAVVYRHCVWSVNTRFTYAACTKGVPEQSRTVKLEGGRDYFWKVLAEDGRGGTTESRTWRVTVK